MKVQVFRALLLLFRTRGAYFSKDSFSLDFRHLFHLCAEPCKLDYFGIKTVSTVLLSMSLDLIMSTEAMNRNDTYFGDSCSFSRSAFLQNILWSAIGCEVAAGARCVAHALGSGSGGLSAAAPHLQRRR